MIKFEIKRTPESIELFKLMGSDNEIESVDGFKSFSEMMTTQIENIIKKEVGRKKDMVGLNEIADAVHKNAKEKGFHPDNETELQFVANQCNNLHAEITELWEAWRKGTQWESCDKTNELSQNCEELADIIIRALDISRRLDIDILRAIQIKHEYNKTRPFKHGKLN